MTKTCSLRPVPTTSTQQPHPPDPPRYFLNPNWGLRRTKPNTASFLDQNTSYYLFSPTNPSLVRGPPPTNRLHAKMTNSSRAYKTRSAPPSYNSRTNSLTEPIFLPTPFLRNNPHNIPQQPNRHYTMTLPHPSAKPPTSYFNFSYNSSPPPYPRHHSPSYPVET
ncbi:hypothetical protein INR49_022839 [Caranx melampygus]|nr:hypothetical protein INR49_022839 [Caranx melampygus]